MYPTEPDLNKILNKIGLHPVNVFDCQTERKYGFGKFCLKSLPFSTGINSLTNHELEGIPNNNLEFERQLILFCKKATVAKLSNQRLTAKEISLH